MRRPELATGTGELARLAGVADQIELIPAKTPEVAGAADIVTNSGQVRPIDAAMVGQLKPSAVIPLMYESWEYRGADVDLEACRRRGIPVAGTNETHPAVDVFSFLGPMAAKQLHDAGIAVHGSHIVLLCDNPFAPFIANYLRGGGARGGAGSRTRRGGPRRASRRRPARAAAGGGTSAGRDHGDGAGRAAPGTVLVQFWGDADRAAAASAGVPVWPPEAPPRPHGRAAVAVGPEPIVRLQAGGLKVGEVLARGLDRACAADLAFAQIL